MLPDLTVLIAMILGLMAFVPGPVSLVRDLAGTVACVIVILALMWMNTRRAVTAVRASKPQVARLSARWMTVLPLLGWLGCILLFDWGHLADAYIPHYLWLGRYALYFLPAGLLFGAGWAAEGKLEQELVRARGGIARTDSVRGALVQGLRRNGIALIPLLFLIGLIEGIWILGDLGVPGLKTFSRWLEVVPLVSLAFMLAILSVLSLALPLILARVFTTEDLPPGRTRDVLERQARMLNLRYGRLLLWKTKGRILNAMVVGFTPRTRTIFLTDALLNHLPEDEVLAVFCHEAGHAKRHHLPLFLLLFIASAILFQVTAEPLLELGVPEHLIVAGHLAFIWFVLFGFVSRLFERDADIYGADHAADLAPAAEDVVVPGLREPLPEGTVRMMRALERVGMVSGRTTSHRHGSIGDRVAYLASYATHDRVRREFATRKRMLLLAIFGLLVLAFGMAAVRLPDDIAYGRSSIAHAEGADDYAAALELPDREAEGTKARWESAYASFQRVRRALAGNDSTRALSLHFSATFNAADTAFHGLGDVERGRKDFEALLAQAVTSDLPHEGLAPLLFQAHIDLGRIEAWAGEVELARGHLDRARAVRPDGEGEESAYDWARMNLLGASIAGAEGRTEEARTLLESEVLGAARGDSPPWVELRDDARIELERLPPATRSPEQPKQGEKPGG